MPFDNPHRMPFGDADLLENARRRISSEANWVQGRYQDGTRRCLVAALSLASESPSFNLPNRLERRLARRLAAHLPSQRGFWARMRLCTPRQRLMWFNDDPRTRHDDVMDLFDRAIDHLKSRMQVSISA